MGDGDGVGSSEPGSARSRTERFLGIRSGDVVAFVGAGGKTTLIHAIAARLAKDGRKVLTTATRPFLPPRGDSPYIFLSDEELFGNLRPILGEHGSVTVAPERLADGSLCGYPPEELDTFADVGDYLFVEAEDAGGESLPPPRTEPRAVPPLTTVLCAVAGLDGLGEDFDEDALAERLVEPGGVLQSRRDLERRILFLHKADREEDRRRAAQVVLALGRRGEEESLKILVTSVRDFLKRL